MAHLPCGGYLKLRDLRRLVLLLWGWNFILPLGCLHLLHPPRKPEELKKGEASKGLSLHVKFVDKWTAVYSLHWQAFCRKTDVQPTPECFERQRLGKGIQRVQQFNEFVACFRHFTAFHGFEMVRIILGDCHNLRHAQTCLVLTSDRLFCRGGGGASISGTPASLNQCPKVQANV